MNKSETSDIDFAVTGRSAMCVNVVEKSHLGLL